MKARALKYILPSLLLATLPINQALAAHKALLIGVGDYKHVPSANLPGIETDIEIMREVALSLGFKKENTKVLLDKDADLATVKRTMSTWLREGVSKNDRVVIYISSHGTQVTDINGDELLDNVDEALTMHDMKYETRNGRAELTGVLLDDDFDQLLGNIPSDHVYVLVDACHSGTATKNLVLPPRALGDVQTVSKFFDYKNMPGAIATKANTRSFSVQASKSEPEGLDPFVSTHKGATNYALLSAAQDTEQSLATTSGSLFTLGVQSAVRYALGNKQERDLTLTNLLDSVTGYISNKLDPNSPQMFHPALSGNNALQNLPLLATAAAAPTQVATAAPAPAVEAPIVAPARAQWDKLQSLVGDAIPLKASLNKQSFRDGDQLEITVDVPRSGYLNIVNVGPTDQTTVLFPNKYTPDNKLVKGKHQFPTSNLPFKLKATAPYGDSAIAVFFTDEPVNLYTSSTGNRASDGGVLDVFSGVPTHTLRSFAVIEGEPEEEEVFASMIETVVKP